MWSLLVSSIRFFSVLFVLAFAVAPALANPGLFKRKTPSERVPSLVETLKGDRDEKKRKSAADELGGADARVHPEVVRALIAALLHDISASVRVEAAEALGQLGQVYPLAGQALESAAESDSSTLVRLAAKRSLWEYHLNGYRTPKGNDDVTFQTVEPPIASPIGPQPAVAIIRTPVASAPVQPLVPKLSTIRPFSALKLPPVAPSGPRLSRSTFLADLFSAARTTNRVVVDAAPPPFLNLTREPPIARPPAITIPQLPPPPSPVPPPTIAVVVPVQTQPPEPEYVPTLPPFKPDLPSVVVPPDEPALAPAPTPVPPSIPATLPPTRKKVEQ